jgi:alpha-D-xyloside xylohydrolase
MQNANYTGNKFRWLLFISLFPLICTGQVVRSYQRASDGINVALREGTLNICPLTDRAIRVRYNTGTIMKIPELIFTKDRLLPKFQISDSPAVLEIKIKTMVAVLDKESGTLSFKDDSGNVFLCEKPGTRKLIPDSVMGEPCFMAEQSFESPAGEYIFGLGQFQDGHYNLRGISRRLIQVNSQIAIPFIYSSRGYGL